VSEFAKCLNPIQPADCPLDGWDPGFMIAAPGPDGKTYELIKAFQCEICGARWTAAGTVPTESDLEETKADA
jgi:hypothetical protein